MTNGQEDYCGIGEWPKDFTEDTKATKCSDLRTSSLTAHAAQVVASLVRGRFEGVLGEFGFRRGTGTGDAIGMLRIVPEGTVDTDGELCACFIQWQKANGRVNADPKGHWH
jgi:hypothetical protein